MREVIYCLYLGDEHLKHLSKGWIEKHCLYVDGEVFIKMVSP